MPNWVTCQVNIHHNDKRMIDRIATIHSQEWDLLQTIYPCPKALVDTIAGSGGGVEVEIAREKQYELNTKVYGYKHWYDWCIANWGTKWGADIEYLNRLDNNNVDITIETAWSPPIYFFNYMESQGYVISCQYIDEGYCFVGEYSSEGIDNSWDNIDQAPDYLLTALNVNKEEEEDNA